MIFKDPLYLALSIAIVALTITFCVSHDNDSPFITIEIRHVTEDEWIPPDEACFEMQEAQRDVINE